MHFIKMDVLSMASTKADYLCLVESIDGVEPLRSVIVLEVNFRLAPLLDVEIKCPDVFEVNNSLASDRDHVLIDQTRCMVCSGTWHWQIV